MTLTQPQFVHAWLLRLDPAWRRLPASQRATEVEEFCSAAERAAARLTLLSYSTIGLRAEGDVLLWRMGQSLEDVE